MGEVPKGRRGLPLKLLTSSSTITPATFGGHPSTANAVPLPSKEGRLGCWLYLPHLWGEVASAARRRGFSLKLLPPFSAITPAASRPPFHPWGSVSLDSQSSAAPYSTAISDSQQFARRFAPPNCVRCCDSSSLATADAVPPPSKEGGLKLDYRCSCFAGIPLFTPFPNKLFHYTINVFTDFSELFTYQPIVISNHGDVIGLQKCGSFPVIGSVLFVVMLFSIQLYDKPDGGAVKITDIMTDNFLPVKLNRISP
jgi:hypothetical protein